MTIDVMIILGFTAFLMIVLILGGIFMILDAFDEACGGWFSYQWFMLKERIFYPPRKDDY